jgi:hypothetical protein
VNPSLSDLRKFAQAHEQDNAWEWLQEFCRSWLANRGDLSSAVTAATPCSARVTPESSRTETAPKAADARTINWESEKPDHARAWPDVPKKRLRADVLLAMVKNWAETDQANGNTPSQKRAVAALRAPSGPSRQQIRKAWQNPAMTSFHLAVGGKHKNPSA